MDTTPKSKVFSRRLHPAQDDSPVFGNSQELDEEIDVLWDWQSPQTALINEKRRRLLKRTISNHSPKIPVKRYPSNTQNFDKFHEELKALQAQLAMPDDEASLCVSPQQEIELKGVAEIVHADLDDFFNESIDEQLIAFSQQIEEQQQMDLVKPKTPESQKCDHSLDKNVILDDSLDDIFAALPDPEPNNIEENTVTSNTVTLSQSTREEIERNRLEALARLEAKKKKNPETWKRTISEENQGNFIQTVSGRVEFHRTRSFELDAIKQHPENLPKSVKEEIERKRLEALARLQAKRNNSKPEATAKNQCSPEEIEKKRLEAVKRQQNSIIEKKRQEALRRLEMNRSRAQQMNRTKLQLLPTHK